MKKGKLFRVKIKFERPVKAGEIGTKEDVKRLKKEAPEAIKDDVKSANVFMKHDGKVLLEEKHLTGHLHARAKGFGLSHKRVSGVGVVTMLKRGVVLVDPFIELGTVEEIEPDFSPGPKGTGITSQEKIWPEDSVEFKVRVLNEEFIPYFQKMMREGYLGAGTSQGHGKFHLESLEEIEE